MVRPSIYRSDFERPIAMRSEIGSNRRLSCDSCQVATRAKDGNQGLGEVAQKMNDSQLVEVANTR